MGTFVFRWPYPADEVYVTGTFDDWGKTVKLEKVGEHWWEKEVELSLDEEKVLYKFVVNGDNWTVDDFAPKEGDGHYNINNVLYRHQIQRKIAGAATETEDVPGAFPETPGLEQQTVGIQPIPASSGAGNPVSLAPGDSVPPHKDITSNTVDSTVTTSKEAYEQAGSSTFPHPRFNPEQSEVSINPLPATEGLGNPITVPSGSGVPPHKDLTSDTVESTVTTSKEDYENAGSSAAVPAPKDAASSEFVVKPIPASSGIGNPVSLPAGAPIPDHKDITTNTVDSTVTTSKEDYDKAGSSAFPVAAAAVGGALGGTALASAFSVPKEEKNLIPESSLPMGGAKTDTLDAGPFISSAGAGTTSANLAAKVPLGTNPTISSSGAGTTTADLASKVPLEEESLIKPSATDSKLADDLEVPLKTAPVIQSSGAGTTTSELASKVPIETAATAAAVPALVKDSISSAHQDPEAAASPEVVKEKSALEKELLSKTQTSEETGAPASAATLQHSYYGLATSVPETVEKSMQEAHKAPEAAADTSVVAEKSAVEQELLAKVPTAEETGEPASTIAAATSDTAPTSTSAATAATSVTDGKTANEPVPDTDTSTAARGVPAGEIAGGAIVGGTAAAGAAALAAKHKDADIEPPRVGDASKPDITTEASPATATTIAPTTTAGIPGQSASAAAAVSDGASEAVGTQVPKSTAPVEKTEAAITEYAPVRTDAMAPGVSSSVAAALSDGTEDPTLADEPAVKLMNQNEAVASTPAPILASTAAKTAAPTASSVQPKTLGAEGSTTTSTDVKAEIAEAGVPSLTSAAKIDDNVTKPSTPAAKAPATPVKQTTQASSPASPGASTAASATTEQKKKKRHRLSRIYHKIFD